MRFIDRYQHKIPKQDHVSDVSLLNQHALKYSVWVFTSAISWSWEWQAEMAGCGMYESTLPHPRSIWNCWLPHHRELHPTPPLFCLNTVFKRQNLSNVFTRTEKLILRAKWRGGEDFNIPPDDYNSFFQGVWSKKLREKWRRMELHNSRYANLMEYISLYGDRRRTVVKVLRYKSEGRWCHWNFSLT